MVAWIRAGIGCELPQQIRLSHSIIHGCRKKFHDFEIENRSSVSMDTVETAHQVSLLRRVIVTQFSSGCKP